MNRKIDDILHRKQDLTEQLADPNITADPKRYAELSREYAEIEPIAETASQLKEIQQQIEDNRRHHRNGRSTLGP